MSLATAHTSGIEASLFSLRSNAVLTLPASRAGRRCLSKLSDAQLAHKRAKDRESQRAIRQRTKDQIETLKQQVKVLSDPAKDLRIVWEIQQRNRELEDEVATLKERVAAMNAGAPLGVPMHLQWAPTMGMGYTGVGEGGIVTPHLGPPPSPQQQQQQQTQQPQASNVLGFGNAAGMLPRADSYAPSNVLSSPSPPTYSPTASFSDLDPGSGIEFGAPLGVSAGADDLVGLGSDFASRQYFVLQPWHLQLRYSRTSLRRYPLYRYPR